MNMIKKLRAKVLSREPFYFDIGSLSDSESVRLYWSLIGIGVIDFYLRAYDTPAYARFNGGGNYNYFGCDLFGYMDFKYNMTMRGAIQSEQHILVLDKYQALAIIKKEPKTVERYLSISIEEVADG